MCTALPLVGDVEECLDICVYQSLLLKVDVWWWLRISLPLHVYSGGCLSLVMVLHVLYVIDVCLFLLYLCLMVNIGL